jgi:class 3 adenylate cyclase
LSKNDASEACLGSPQVNDAATDERFRRTRLANIRQELLAPVSAIMGYADLLLEDARRQNLAEVVPDLERIATSGRELLELIDRFLDVDALARRRTEDDFTDMQSRLRHDLRNPLNAIKGYSELLLEDLEDIGGEPLQSDLEVLLAEAQRLLSQIDVIVDFSSDGGTATGDDQEATMVAELVRTIRPIASDDRQSHEIGRILVVDDNDSNRALLVRRLSRDGHEVAEADGGRKALEMLEQDTFDLVLLDLLMPDMNGFQVLQTLKNDPRLRDIRVIMVSGQQETDAVMRCIEAGAEDYLPKPFDPVLLDARINACLERKKGRDREREYLRQIQTEKEKSEALLLNILPAQIVARINSGEALIADRFDGVTVLFADFVGFTTISSRLQPARLVETLNNIFSEFDRLAQTLGVEKIKTIGDAYLAAAGLPEGRPDHTEVVADMALGMIDHLDRINATLDTPWQIRIGIHTGPVVAGVIGTHKFVYDVWGDTVNTASRIETSGEPGRIHVSEAVANVLKPRFNLERRGITMIRGKGAMKTYFLKRRKANTADLATGSR